VLRFTEDQNDFPLEGLVVDRATRPLHVPRHRNMRRKKRGKWQVFLMFRLHLDHEFVAIAYWSWRGSACRYGG
jgi:hypothetical protein